MILFLLSCGKFQGGGDDSGSAQVEDSDPGIHPNVPEGYEYWDVTACEDGETRYYRLAEGRSDADGNLDLTERIFYFYGGDWEDDVIDTYSYVGTRMTTAEMLAIENTEHEEGYAVLRTGVDIQSGSWGSDDEDMLLTFDTLTPSGTLNWENAMLVYRYRESSWGDEDGWRGDYDFARGEFWPDDEDDPVPPATYTWQSKDCAGSW